MFTSQNQWYQGQGLGAAGGGVSPQGFDFGNIINTVAQGAAQVLPGLLMSLLSAHPQLQQLSRQGGVNPQSNVGYGAGLNPFGAQSGQQQGVGGQQGVGLQQGVGGQQGVGLQPQGFDFASIINSVAQSAAQALPGLLVSLLSAHPQIQQISRQGDVSTQGWSGLGLNALSGTGGGQYGGQYGQQYGQQSGQQQAGVSPQGFDFSGIINSVAQSAAQALPGLLIGLLSAQPQIQQMNRQGGALNPQGQIPQGQIFSGVNIGSGPGVSPQGFDFGSIARGAADLIAPQIPVIVNSVLGQLLGRQSSGQTIH